MKRVVVTGGTGFVGANVVRAMLARGNETHLFVRPQYRDWRIRSIANDLQLHVVDLCDQSRVTELLRAIQPDWVFHLAAYGGYESQMDAMTAMRTNLEATVSLLLSTVQIGFESFVHTGSSSEYGRKDHPPAESEGIQPNSYYAVMKAAATLFCQHVGSALNANVSTLRLYSVYGPFEEPTRLIPTLISRGFRGELPPLTAPETVRDFVYVDDVVAALARSAELPQLQAGKVFNIGTGKQTSLREVVALTRRVFQIEREEQWGSMSDRSWDTAVWIANPTRAAEELGWTAGTPFEVGFQRTVDWLAADEEMRRFYAQQHALPS